MLQASDRALGFSNYPKGVVHAHTVATFAVCVLAGGLGWLWYTAAGGTFAPPPAYVAAEAVDAVARPGDPAFNRPIDGKYLPNPAAKFGGTINLNANDSTPYWPPRVVPPKGAPNVLLIMTDDVGLRRTEHFRRRHPHAQPGSHRQDGPALHDFHSTALCSPTRAALITGRNHHSVGFGVISEMSTGYPGYNSIIGKDKATIGTSSKQNGYGTSWFGKNHNTPAFSASQAGPFDQWPTGMGFDYFYGFVGGDTSQWQPNLFRNTTPSPLTWQSRLEPDHRDGGRGHRAG